MTTLSMPSTDRLVTGQPSTLELRPRYEGCNICTWIGFKHVNYLVEEAVLGHFRACGYPARALFEDHGVGLDLVDLDTRILHALHADDVAEAVVTPVTREGDESLRYTVTMTVERDGKPVKAVTSKVGVLLRTDTRGGPAEPPVGGLEAFTVERIDRSPALLALDAGTVTGDLATSRQAGKDPVIDALVGDANAFAWRWRVPYFYCHFTERMQMSGYLRLMEEIVDLFLADRGVSIRTLLDDQDWIPVVPHSAIHLVGEAPMESELYTVFTVEDVFKDFTYTARMDCYVPSGQGLVQTATGRITHGYAVIENRRDWSLVNFDERMLQALSGAGRNGAAS